MTAESKNQTECKDDAQAARDRMLRINQRQEAFYESRAEAAAEHSDKEKAANAATNLWTKMRRFVQRKGRESGLAESINALHRCWMGDLSESRVLDLGAASGNPLSLEIAGGSREYHAIDLSPSQIAILQSKLTAAGLADKARAYVLDFLANEWPDGYFDVVYAHSVLHHFKYLSVMLTELRRVIRPGGFVISTDPLQTDPFNRVARIIYRPFQTDREWEWPFTRRALRTISTFFDIESAQGYDGLSKFGFLIGPSASRATLKFDQTHANRIGGPFYMCWKCTLKLTRR